MSEKTNRQIESDKRRLHILETAVVAFLELGYQRTGVREIAKRAGVSLGNLYNHFSGKEAVLIEIAQLEALAVAPFIEGLKEDRSAPVCLARFIKSYLPYASQVDNVLLSVEILAEAVRTPAVAEAFGVTRKNLISSIADILEALGQPHPTEVARLILDMIDAHARFLVFSGQACTRKDCDIVLKMVGSGINLNLQE